MISILIKYIAAGYCGPCCKYGDEYSIISYTSYPAFSPDENINIVGGDDATAAMVRPNTADSVMMVQNAANPGYIEIDLVDATNGNKFVKVRCSLLVLLYMLA